MPNMQNEENKTTQTENNTPSAPIEEINKLIEENKDDTEQSVRDEGRDDAAVIIDKLSALMDEKFAQIDKRISDIERTQRDTFSSMIINGGVVTDRSIQEVDNADNPAYSSNVTEDFDLSLE